MYPYRLYFLALCGVCEHCGSVYLLGLFFLCSIRIYPFAFEIAFLIVFLQKCYLLPLGIHALPNILWILCCIPFLQFLPLYAV